MKNLTEKEMIAIDGGNTSTPGISMSLNSHTDSLLSITFESHYGDRSQTTTLSVLNNVSLGLNSLFNTTTK